MGDRYDVLAEHFVDIDGRYASDEEVIAMLKRRVAPIPFSTQNVAVAA